MENQFQLQYDGQQVQQSDLNGLGETSGLADDRVFAELLRMLPFNGTSPARGILPYAHTTSGNAATVAPNGATGSVLINPIRAFIGPRTAVSTDPKANWRDVRSAIAVGSATLGTGVGIAPNTSGNPRWDLVYAAVNIQANGLTSTRKVKDPTSLLVTTNSVVTTIVSAVTFGVQAGTPAASPVWPSAPSDSGTTYYIPLAFIRVPNGFGSTSTVLTTDIAVQAPILRLARSLGAHRFSVADQQYNVTVAQQQSWGATGTRPKVWMPPDITGCESVFVAMDLSTTSSLNWSHQDGSVVDSRDWRGRICKYTLQNPVHGTGFTWNDTLNSGPSGDELGIKPKFGGTGAPTDGFGAMDVGIGNTMNEDSIGSGKATCAVAFGSRLEFNNVVGPPVVKLYCDLSDSGKLKVSISGTPDAILFFWLEFTGPYTNK